MKLRTTDPMSSYNVYDVRDLEELVQEQLTSENEEAPLLIFGAPGIGKTAILREAISKLPDGKQWKLVVKTLSTETADNFFLPKYIEVNEQNLATDIPKDWLPVYKPTGDPKKDEELDRSLGKGLLFIDELSRAVPIVLSVCLSLVHERIFNGYKVGSGWKIICASNRPEDEIVGQSELSNALVSRFGVAYFEPTPEGWSHWAQKQSHISPMFLQWIQMAESENLSGRKYFYWDPNDSGVLDNKVNMYCMPRTWDNAFKRLAKSHPSGNLRGFNILEIPREKVEKRLGLFIPSEPIGIFFNYLNTVSAVGDFREALDVVWKGKGKLKITKRDLQKIALPLTQFLISAHEKDFPTAEEFEHFADWLVEMNSEQLTSYALDVFYNVFGQELNKNQASVMYLGAERYKELHHSNELGAKGKIPLYDEVSKAWCERWGWKNLGEAPNWSKGFAKLQKAFAERFAMAKVGELDGLD